MPPFISLLTLSLFLSLSFLIRQRKEAAKAMRADVTSCPMCPRRVCCRRADKLSFAGSSVEGGRGRRRAGKDRPAVSDANESRRSLPSARRSDTGLKQCRDRRADRRRSIARGDELTAAPLSSPSGGSRGDSTGRREARTPYKRDCLRFSRRRSSSSSSTHEERAAHGAPARSSG